MRKEKKIFVYQKINKHLHLIFFQYSQLYKNRFCGLVVIPEVIDNIQSKRGTFDWLMAN